VAVTVSFPAGARVAVHDPDPEELKVAVHRSVPPIAKSTLPVGVPCEPVTVAEYVTLCP
jgi:hypothetical protein